MANNDIEIHWCSDPKMSDELARFFAAHITTEYISHSELQGPRALDVGKWAPDLTTVFYDEISKRISEGKGLIKATGESYPVLYVTRAGKLVALALVSFFPEAPRPYCMVEDVVVDQSLRASGIGTAIINWVGAEAKRVNCIRLFLESGHDNERAHHFFEREGFQPISVVMMKDLRRSS